MTPPWSVALCRRCHWRHDAADPCDPTRLAAADAARAADVQPGEFIADTPRTWSSAAPAAADGNAAWYQAHARVK